MVDLVLRPLSLSTKGVWSPRSPTSPRKKIPWASSTSPLEEISAFSRPMAQSSPWWHNYEEIPLGKKPVGEWSNLLASVSRASRITIQWLMPVLVTLNAISRPAVPNPERPRHFDKGPELLALSGIYIFQQTKIHFICVQSNGRPWYWRVH